MKIFYDFRLFIFEHNDGDLKNLHKNITKLWLKNQLSSHFHHDIIIIIIIIWDVANLVKKFIPVSESWK